ncbi:MAG: VCBS repeat-containing protein [Planctomycetes bacterium]|nr:VCBS repeat-containing protein [Planctomycetota bacterium]
MRLQEWTRAFLAMALLGSSGLCGRVSAEVAFVTADQWTSAGPQSVAVADFDEDGVFDVVLASPLSDTLEVRYGIGNGFFSGPLTHSVDFPFHVLASDLDLDGHADVVTANLLDGSFSFMYGDGLGHFTAVESQAIGGSPIAVAVGDFDENGVRDLAFADFSAGEIRTCLGNGARGFGAAVTVVDDLPAASFVICVDMNQDGHVDLVGTSGNQSSFGVFFGDGNGGFSIYQQVDIGVDDSLWDIAARDLNGDFLLDLVIPCPNLDFLVVYPGTAFGALGEPRMIPSGDTPEATEIRDVDGDGFQDVVSVNSSSNDICVNVGDGDLQFTDPLGFAVGNASASLAPGDFDADGREDFIVAGGVGEVRVVLNRSTPSDVWFVRGDANGDGTLGIGDAIVSLDYLFGPGLLGCPDAADLADDGSVSIGDVILLLDGLFGSATLPIDCGPDTTLDIMLGCDDAWSCAP